MAQMARMPAAVEQLGFAARMAARDSHRARDAMVGRMLCTDRLSVRPLCLADRSAFIRAMSENRVHLARFMPLGVEGESDEAVFLRQLAQAEAGDATGRDWRRVAFDGRGRLAGGVNINNIRRALESCGEMTVWIDRGQTGAGLAAELLKGAIDHAFAPILPRGEHCTHEVGLGLDRLTGLIATENHVSRALAMRLGFARSALSPRIDLLIGGHRIEHDEYALYAPLSGRSVVHALPAAPGARARQAEMIPQGRPLASLPPSMRRDLSRVLRIEAASADRLM